MRFSFSQLFKAKDLIKGGKVKIEKIVNQKIYFKVKEYDVILDLKNKKDYCSCFYFSLFSKNKKICSHIIACHLLIEGDKWLLKELKKRKDALCKEDSSKNL
jgi:predicted nucleic acid-binding Zn finger protein